jgi:dihydrofolate reductase
MKISMIVAYGKNWEIGLNNQMLWHIPEDFKKFKEITSGHHILMGRKTFESIGKPLPNRTSLVLTRGNFSYENVEVFNEVENAIEFARNNGETELFIIGGANIYNTLFHLVDTMYLSEVDFEGEADSFLNSIDFTNWNKMEEKRYEKIVRDNEKTIPSWTFRVFEKNR